MTYAIDIYFRPKNLIKYKEAISNALEIIEYPLICVYLDFVNDCKRVDNLNVEQLKSLIKKIVYKENIGPRCSFEMVLDVKGYPLGIKFVTSIHDIKETGKIYLLKLEIQNDSNNWKTMNDKIREDVNKIIRKLKEKIGIELEESVGKIPADE